MKQVHLFGEGKVNQQELKPLYAQEPSEDEGGSTAITFVNRVKTAVEVFWIDTEGNAVAYGTVQPVYVLRVDGVPIVSVYKR